MVKKVKYKDIQFIDFLSFVEHYCCKKYLQTLDTYELKNDITSKDVQMIFYHTLIDCIIKFFISLKTLDKKIFYVDKYKLVTCCLKGDNDTKTFLKFFISFIKKLKTHINLGFICDNHSFTTYLDELQTDAYLQEELAKVLHKRDIKAEKVWKFLDKNGLKLLSDTYRTETKVKFWLQ